MHAILKYFPLPTNLTNDHKRSRQRLNFSFCEVKPLFWSKESGGFGERQKGPVKVKR